MNPFSRYPQPLKAHPERPWWHRIVTRSDTYTIGDVSDLVYEEYYWRRRDGQKTPEKHCDRRNERTTPEMFDLDEIKRIDKENPMAMPSLLVGQVWGWWRGDLQGDMWVERPINEVISTQESSTPLQALEIKLGDTHMSLELRTQDVIFANKVLLYGPLAPWAPGDWK